jgi:hypothetical protein
LCSAWAEHAQTDGESAGDAAADHGQDSHSHQQLIQRQAALATM